MSSMSRMHRLQIGDVVSWQDFSEHPPISMEGTITEFANEELTYIVIDFGDGDIRTLTEDEVRRVA